ncbi:MAG: hypothetical protein AAF721_09775 [Myxococcota bacterium]
MRTSIALTVSIFALSGCPDDGNSGDGPADGSTSAPATGTGGDDGMTNPPSTGAVESGGTTTEPGDSDTTAAADATTTTAGDASTGSTGPICEPGTEDCACDGGACDDGLECTGDVCLPPGACTEHPEGEPNDDEMSAIDLGPVQGCAVAEIAGAVDAGDSDWFTYQGTHDPECALDTSGILTADPELEVCMFWECEQGTEQVVCFGMPEAISPGGRPGCCGPANNVVFMQRQCLGVGDQPNGDVYLEVRGGEVASCVDYDLGYIF